MSKPFNIIVNSHHQFKLNANQLTDFDVVETSPKQYHILKEHTSYSAEITASDQEHKFYTVKVNNSKYEVVIQDELDVLIQKMGFEQSASKQINIITAPMPGLILEVLVTVGQQVSANETLLVLEAMKMENSITAPHEATVKTINIAQGDAVDKGQLLIELE